MAKRSKEAEFEGRREAEALMHFERVLHELRDPRRRQGQPYSLRVVVVTALMAMVCGADDAEAMQDWSEANSEWLAGLFDLPPGVPTQDVYLAEIRGPRPGGVRRCLPRLGSAPSGSGWARRAYRRGRKDQPPQP